MANIYEIHPQTPQTRKIDEIVAALKSGAVMLYPTDTVYAIGCDLNSKAGVDRVRKIKRMSNDKPLTFLCQSLSNISDYADVSDPAYRLMKQFKLHINRTSHRPISIIRSQIRCPKQIGRASCRERVLMPV